MCGINVMCLFIVLFFFFFFNDTATTEIYTLSLHDALPIYAANGPDGCCAGEDGAHHGGRVRSEEHTSELQSRSDLVCRLLLENKKNSEGPAPRAPSLSYYFPARRARPAH